MQNIAVNGCLRQKLLPVEKKLLFIYLFILVYLRREQCWLKDRIIFTNWGLSVISLPAVHRTRSQHRCESDFASQCLTASILTLPRETGICQTHSHIHIAVCINSKSENVVLPLGVLLFCTKSHKINCLYFLAFHKAVVRIFQRGTN